MCVFGRKKKNVGDIITRVRSLWEFLWGYDQRSDNGTVSSAVYSSEHPYYFKSRYKQQNAVDVVYGIIFIKCRKTFRLRRQIRRYSIISVVVSERIPIVFYVARTILGGSENNCRGDGEAESPRFSGLNRFDRGNRRTVLLPGTALPDFIKKLPEPKLYLRWK